MVNKRRHLRSLADAVGADTFNIVRESKHMVVDFFFGTRSVRTTLSVSMSDSVFGIKNQIGELRRSARRAGILA